MRTKLNLLLTALILQLAVLAQLHDHSNGLCGTHTLGPEQETWLRAFQQRPYYQKIQSRSQTLKSIPLSIHIVGDDAGDGYYDIEDLLHSMCIINQHYAQANFLFFIKGEIEYINNSEYYDHDYNAGRQMMNNHNVDSTVNVYFCRQAVEGNCGYFDYYGDAVAITNGCQQGDATTLTHELGHFLSLPHTFSGWEGRSYDENPLPENRRERQNRVNCTWTGDGFCDTPPDYHSERWNCPYSFGYVDPAGVAIETDGSLFMSYSNDACQSSFSQEQIEAMHANVEEVRRDLIQSQEIEALTLDVPQLVYPYANAYDVPENYVVFGWDPVEGADQYHIQVTTRFGSFNALMIDEILDINYMVNTTDFLFDKTYKYRVRAISKGTYCTDFSEEREFTIYAPAYEVDDSWNIWLEDSTTQEDSTTHINPSHEVELKVYPNPANNQELLTIVADFRGLDLAQIEVRDITGRLMINQSQQVSPSTYLVDVKSLDSGIYFINMQFGTKIMSQKILID